MPGNNPPPAEECPPGQDNPPGDTPPADTPPPPDGPPPPGDEPPGDTPPADTPPPPDEPPPPGDEPPGDEPPGDEPPGDEPPGDEPPGDEPPGDEPPGDEPPGDEPPQDEPPQDNPPQDNPPQDEPPADTPPPEHACPDFGDWTLRDEFSPENLMFDRNGMGCDSAVFTWYLEHGHSVEQVAALFDGLHRNFNEDGMPLWGNGTDMRTAGEILAMPADEAMEWLSSMSANRDTWLDAPEGEQAVSYFDFVHRHQVGMAAQDLLDAYQENDPAAVREALDALAAIEGAPEILERLASGHAYSVYYDGEQSEFWLNVGHAVSELQLGNAVNSIDFGDIILNEESAEAAATEALFVSTTVLSADELAGLNAEEQQLYAEQLAWVQEQFGIETVAPPGEAPPSNTDVNDPEVQEYLDQVEQYEAYVASVEDAVLQVIAGSTDVDIDELPVQEQDSEASIGPSGAIAEGMGGPQELG